MSHVSPWPPEEGSEAGLSSTIQYSTVQGKYNSLRGEFLTRSPRRTAGIPPSLPQSAGQP